MNKRNLILGALLGVVFYQLAAGLYRDAKAKVTA